LVDGGIHCMIWEGCLLITYWPFAFFQYPRIKNAVLPCRGVLMSGDEQAFGKRSDLSNIHTFGCCAWVKYTSAKEKQHNVDCKKG
jgi:hypothetical protein